MAITIRDNSNKPIRIEENGKTFDFPKPPSNVKGWLAKNKKILEGNSPRAKAFKTYKKNFLEEGGMYQEGGSFTGNPRVYSTVQPETQRLEGSLKKSPEVQTENLEELYREINNAAFEVAKTKKNIKDFYASEQGHFNKEIIGSTEKHSRALRQSLFEKERVRDSLRQRAGEIEQLEDKYENGGVRKYQNAGIVETDDSYMNGFSNEAGTIGRYTIDAVTNPNSSEGYMEFRTREKKQKDSNAVPKNTPEPKNSISEVQNPGAFLPSQDETLYKGANLTPFTNVVDTPEFLSWAESNLQPASRATQTSVQSEGFASNPIMESEMIQQAPSAQLVPSDASKNLTDIERTSSDTTQPETTEFNPYVGVDIPSAAGFLGKSIESGDVGMGIASGAKLGVGLARNIFGGMGRERRRGEINDEYRENQKEQMEGNTSYKEDGGYYEMGGVMPAPMQSAYQGMNVYEDGGEQLPQEKIMTGEVMQGVSENNQGVQPNSELEQGEHIHSQDGSSIKVEGKDHEEGGEKMELQEGDRIISNNLQLKKQNAKKLKDKFDNKFSTKDTYAKAVDKIYSSIGLSKIIKEEEQILKKLSKVEEKVQDETTKNLNAEFLYKKLEEVQKKKDELEPLRQEALTTVFELQENSKPKPKEEETSEFEDGGIKQLSLKYGIPEKRAKQIIDEFKKGGYYQDGGDFKSKVKAALDKAGYSGEDLIGQSESLKDIPEGQSKKILEEIGITAYGDVDAKGVLETVTRNPWYDWSTFDGSEDAVKNFQTKYNEKVEEGSTLEVDGKFGEQTQSAYIPFLETPDEGMGDLPTQTASEDKVKTESSTETGDDTGQNNQGVNMPMTPDQGVIPPSAMASQLDVTRRYDRINPELTSAEAIISENQRQATAAIRSAQDLPDSQRAATIAQINANLQQANNQAISQTEMNNAQIRNQAQNTNAQIQMGEEAARAEDALDYERRQQTAESLTEENVRQFYDYLRKLNASNFNDNRRRNTLNQMYENFDIDSMGNVTNKGESINKAQAESVFASGLGQGVVAQRQAKKGGKFKNKK